MVMQAKVSDQYCGLKNCYDLLNVTKDAPDAEIRRAYRGLSVIWHPDKNPDYDTTEIFRELVQAYEILSNPELREAYNEYLENPQKSEAYHYYKFYKAKYSPQADPKVVLGSFLLLFSAFQYWNRKRMYENALAYLVNNPKYMQMVIRTFEDEKAANPQNYRSKAQIANELKYTVNIHGGYAPPKITELIGVQVILLPWTIAKTLWFYARWGILFGLLRKDYGPAEREYMTIKSLRLNEMKWKMQNEEARAELIELELWKKENMLAYLKDMEEEQKEKYADSAKYKKYKRYMKKMK
jgi:DnaJ family protein C protein 25